MNHVTYRGYRDGDEQAILDLYNAVFAKPQSLAQWRWAYRGNPVGRLDIALAFDGVRLIAHAAGIPLVLSHEGQLVQTSRIQNVLVHADYRGRGIFTETLLHLTHHLAAQEVDFVLTFPNNNSLPGFRKTGLYRHAFDVHQFQLDAASMLPAEDRRVAVEIENHPGFRHADVELMRRALAPFPIHTVRDLPYLTWRYHQESAVPYRMARAFCGSELVGLAVFKLYAADRCVDLLELVVAPGTITDTSLVAALLRSILAAYPDAVPQAFNLWSLPHHPLHGGLLHLGFKPSVRTTHAMYRTFSARCSSRAGDPTAYHLSMGDSDVY